MAENINAHCDICGVGYHVCNSCADQLKLRPWRVVTDTVDHYKIFLAIHTYSVTGNKAKAKKELEKCNLTDKETFRPDIKAVIAEIMDNKGENIETVETEKIDSTEDVSSGTSSDDGVKVETEAKSVNRKRNAVNKRQK